ncbi:hypothetical protein [Kamptonema formosum]|uniref:hypothetical protein n=1 Tax=Kamptonema formosum TaxID=331992 RepID=UPI0012DE9381|nr:hypothetical protein [Oscillatoria sp. PCC 10802]
MPTLDRRDACPTSGGIYGVTQASRLCPDAWVWPIRDRLSAGSRTLRDIWRPTGQSACAHLGQAGRLSYVWRDIWRNTGVSPVPRRLGLANSGQVVRRFVRLEGPPRTGETPVLRLGLEVVQMSAG